jgi:Ca2+-binding RTX toxin-like protein
MVARMRRNGFRTVVLASTVGLVLMLCAAPAEAAMSCGQVGAIVTATFTGTSTSTTMDKSTISQSAGGQILVDGTQCNSTATLTNTDTIKVVGDASDERLTIDLVNGTFLGGATPEGADGEVEFEVDLAANIPVEGTADVVILGTNGVDDITLGEFLAGPECSSVFACTAANLNAGEATGDADVVADDTLNFSVSALGNDDILSSNGGDGMPRHTISSDIDAGSGDDDLTLFWFGTPGPGNDTVRFPAAGFGVVRYVNAPGPVNILAKDGTGGDWGGTLAGQDGEVPGGTDTYIGTAGQIDGTAVGDTFNGSSLNDVVHGSGGNDTINGAAGDDNLAGDSGMDTIQGGADNDQVRGDSGNDFVFGDAGNDIVDGGLNDDNENGGPGDDVFRQSGFITANPTQPNGADDMHGDAGIDLVQYGDTSTSSAGVKRTAAVSVDFDGNFDDGAISPSEGDNARPDIENANGGNGNDTLVGDGDPNVLRGWVGADNLTGGGGDDQLEGLGATGPNAAAIDAALTDSGDTFNAVGGADVVNANEGDDTISSVDGFADTLNCGPGTDSGTKDDIDLLSDCEFPSPVGPGGGGTSPTGSTGGTTGGGSVTSPPVDPPSADIATATRRAGCLSIPGVVRDQRKTAPGGGQAILQTRQVDDPARPLRVAVRLTGSPRIRSVVFKVNGRTVPAATTTARVAAGSTPARPVTQDLLKIGGGRGARNTVVATVTLVGGRRVVLTQFLVILKCATPVTSCTRQPDGRSLRCTSSTPLGGRRARITVSRTAREVATGTATITRGRYTAIVRSATALSAGTYAYKHVVTTAKPRQRFLMIRTVRVT